MGDSKAATQQSATAQSEAFRKMSLLRYTKDPVCPPDRFRFRFTQDGHTVISFSRDGWERGILKHYRDNGYPLPEDWLAQAEDQMCRLLPAGFCEYENGSQPQTFIDRRGFNITDAIHATQVFVNWVKQGVPLVSEAEAESRGRICSACYAMDSIPGCGSCYGIANTVAEVVGAKTTSADAILEGKACLVCRCSAKANIWIPVEVSKAAVSETMMTQFPDFCWKKQGIEALQVLP